MGVTQQAASQAVADLERRGYVERVAGAEDARVRSVSLTGRAAIDAGRRHRGARGRAGGAAGPRQVEAARRLLAEAGAALGAETAVRGRRLRPPL
jgi:DNA-binding MarR family transcriptional regulator